MPREIRYYVLLEKTDAELLQRYRHANLDAVSNVLKANLPPHLQGVFRVESLPSNDIGIVGGGPPPPFEKAPDALVVGIRVDADAVDDFHDAVNSQSRPTQLQGGGIDLPIASTDHWCPGEATDPIFADRTAAELLLHIPEFRRQPGTDGAGINVVVIDHGLDRSQLQGNYHSGWKVGDTEPGMTTHAPDSVRRGHGMMIANNIWHVAPGVRLFDMPLIQPQGITNIPQFLSVAYPAYLQMLADIRQFGGGRWVLVNPWAVFDTRTDLAPPRDYCANRDDRFNRKVIEAVALGIVVVFAAGNCGQFCPDRRCGPADRGPSHSIHGANSLPEVLTVGAVRADNMWLGYSSQGPGRIGPPANQKPDLCASSQFRESDDAFKINTGTSAACALTAGVVAGLLSKWSTLTSAAINRILTTTATPAQPPSPDRFGAGILNAEEAYNRAPTLA